MKIIKSLVHSPALKALLSSLSILIVTTILLVSYTSNVNAVTCPSTMRSCASDLAPCDAGKGCWIKDQPREDCCGSNKKVYKAWSTKRTTKGNMRGFAGCEKIMLQYPDECYARRLTLD